MAMDEEDRLLLVAAEQLRAITAANLLKQGIDVNEPGRAALDAAVWPYLRKVKAEQKDSPAA